VPCLAEAAREKLLKRITPVESLCGGLPCCKSCRQEQSQAGGSARQQDGQSATTFLRVYSGCWICALERGDQGA
jgi:hypothetical protein